MFVALLCFTISAIFIVNNKATISVSYNADGIVEICNTSAENYNGLDIEIWNMDGEKFTQRSVEKENCCLHEKISTLIMKLKVKRWQKEY